MRQEKPGDSRCDYDRDVYRDRGKVRAHAERLHDEAQIMHLDPVPQRDLALGAASVAVVQASRRLPPEVYAESPWDGWARLRSMHMGQGISLPSYETAIAMAAHWTAYAAAKDRAEHADPTSGTAA